MNSFHNILNSKYNNEINECKKRNVSAKTYAYLLKNSFEVPIKCGNLKIGMNNNIYNSDINEKAVINYNKNENTVLLNDANNYTNISNKQASSPQYKTNTNLKYSLLKNGLYNINLRGLRNLHSESIGCVNDIRQFNVQHEYLRNITENEKRILNDKLNISRNYLTKVHTNIKTDCDNANFLHYDKTNTLIKQKEDESKKGNSVLKVCVESPSTTLSSKGVILNNYNSTKKVAIGNSLCDTHKENKTGNYVNQMSLNGLINKIEEKKTTRALLNGPKNNDATNSLVRKNNNVSDIKCHNNFINNVEAIKYQHNKDDSINNKSDKFLKNEDSNFLMRDKSHSALKDNNLSNLKNYNNNSISLYYFNDSNNERNDIKKNTSKIDSEVDLYRIRKNNNGLISNPSICKFSHIKHKRDLKVEEICEEQKTNVKQREYDISYAYMNSLQNNKYFTNSIKNGIVYNSNINNYYKYDKHKCFSNNCNDSDNYHMGDNYCNDEAQGNNQYGKGKLPYSVIKRNEIKHEKNTLKIGVNENAKKFTNRIISADVRKNSCNHDIRMLNKEETIINQNSVPTHGLCKGNKENHILMNNIYNFKNVDSNYCFYLRNRNASKNANEDYYLYSNDLNNLKNGQKIMYYNENSTMRNKSYNGYIKHYNRCNNFIIDATISNKVNEEDVMLKQVSKNENRERSANDIPKIHNKTHYESHKSEHIIDSSNNYYQKNVINLESMNFNQKTIVDYNKNLKEINNPDFVNKPYNKSFANYSKNPKELIKRTKSELSYVAIDNTNFKENLYVKGCDKFEAKNISNFIDTHKSIKQEEEQMYEENENYDKNKKLYVENNKKNDQKKNISLNNVMGDDSNMCREGKSNVSKAPTKSTNYIKMEGKNSLKEEQAINKKNNLFTKETTKNDMKIILKGNDNAVDKSEYEKKSYIYNDSVTASNTKYIEHLYVSNEKLDEEDNINKCLIKKQSDKYKQKLVSEPNSSCVLKNTKTVSIATQINSGSRNNSANNSTTTHSNIISESNGNVFSNNCASNKYTKEVNDNNILYNKKKQCDSVFNNYTSGMNYEKLDANVLTDSYIYHLNNMKKMGKQKNKVIKLKNFKFGSKANRKDILFLRKNRNNDIKNTCIINKSIKKNNNQMIDCVENYIHENKYTNISDTSSVNIKSNNLIASDEGCKHPINNELFTLNPFNVKNVNDGYTQIKNNLNYDGIYYKDSNNETSNELLHKKSKEVEGFLNEDIMRNEDVDLTYTKKSIMNFCDLSIGSKIKIIHDSVDNCCDKDSEGNIDINTNLNNNKEHKDIVTDNESICEDDSLSNDEMTENKCNNTSDCLSSKTDSIITKEDVLPWHNDNIVKVNVNNKLKKTKDVTINIKLARCERVLINTCVNKLNWKKCNDNTNKGIFYWIGHNVNDLDHYNYMKKKKIINRIPSLYMYTKKKALTYLLSHLSVIYPSLYDFYPNTFVLPENKNIIKHVLNNNNNDYYIMKPDSGSMGIGVKLIHKYSDININILNGYNCYIIQKYIDNPLLMYKKKFDFRIYILLLPGKNYPKIYISKIGFARLCTEEYKKKKKYIGNTYVHLTNYSINKDNEKYIRKKNIHDKNNNKQLLSDVFIYLKNKGYDINDIWQQIKKIGCLTSLAMYSYIKSKIKYNLKNNFYFYQLIGLDVLLDNNGKVWLLEVNSNPSLRIDYLDPNYSYFEIQLESMFDRYVKEPVISEMFMIVYKKIYEKYFNKKSKKSVCNNNNKGEKEVMNNNKKNNNLNLSESEFQKDVLKFSSIHTNTKRKNTVESKKCVDSSPLYLNNNKICTDAINSCRNNFLDERTNCNAKMNSLIKKRRNKKKILISKKENITSIDTYVDDHDTDSLRLSGNIETGDNENTNLLKLDKNELKEQFLKNPQHANKSSCIKDAHLEYNTNRDFGVERLNFLEKMNKKEMKEKEEEEAAEGGGREKTLTKNKLLKLNSVDKAEKKKNAKRNCCNNSDLSYDNCGSSIGFGESNYIHKLGDSCNKEEDSENRNIYLGSSNGDSYINNLDNNGSNNADSGSNSYNHELYKNNDSLIESNIFKNETYILVDNKEDVQLDNFVNNDLKMYDYIYKNISDNDYKKKIENLIMIRNNLYKYMNCLNVLGIKYVNKDAKNLDELYTKNFSFYLKKTFTKVRKDILHPLKNDALEKNVYINLKKEMCQYYDQMKIYNNFYILFDFIIKKYDDTLKKKNKFEYYVNKSIFLSMCKDIKINKIIENIDIPNAAQNKFFEMNKNSRENKMYQIVKEVCKNNTPCKKENKNIYANKGANTGFLNDNDLPNSNFSDGDNDGDNENCFNEENIVNDKKNKKKFILPHRKNFKNMNSLRNNQESNEKNQNSHLVSKNEHNKNLYNNNSCNSKLFCPFSLVSTSNNLVNFNLIETNNGKNKSKKKKKMNIYDLDYLFTRQVIFSKYINKNQGLTVIDFFLLMQQLALLVFPYIIYLSNYNSIYPYNSTFFDELNNQKDDLFVATSNDKEMNNLKKNPKNKKKTKKDQNNDIVEKKENKSNMDNSSRHIKEFSDKKKDYLNAHLDSEINRKIYGNNITQPEEKKNNHLWHKNVCNNIYNLYEYLQISVNPNVKNICLETFLIYIFNKYGIAYNS